MGESRPVIRLSQDSRCYVNIPTAMPSSALPLCCTAPAPQHESQGNIWFSVLERTLSVWHVVHVQSVSIWTRRPTPASILSLLPLTSQHLSYYSGCTMHSGSPDSCWPKESIVDRETNLRLKMGKEKNFYNLFWHGGDTCLPVVHKNPDRKDWFTLLESWKLSLNSSYNLCDSPHWTNQH